jgi:hypothetical protein
VVSCVVEVAAVRDPIKSFLADMNWQVPPPEFRNGPSGSNSNKTSSSIAPNTQSQNRPPNSSSSTTSSTTLTAPTSASRPTPLQNHARQEQSPATVSTAVMEDEPVKAVKGAVKEKEVVKTASKPKTTAKRGLKRL